MGVLAFDIETYGDYAGLSDRLKAYFARRDRNRGVEADDPRSATRQVSLFPGLARVIAVGLWSGDEGRGVSLALDPRLPLPERREKSGEGEIVFFKSETDLLRSFWERVGFAAAQGGRLISFNGRGFDGPVLTVRSAVLGVEPSVDLVGPRRSLRPHCDLSEAFGFFGASRVQLSLEYWCEVFEVDSPKTTLRGEDVAGTFERGEYTEIARYALRDARATAEIYTKVAPTLIKSLERGEVGAS